MDNEKIRQLMEKLGFDFTNGVGRAPTDTPEQREKFAALQELLAGFGAELAGATRDEMWAMEETAQEWLVG